nr:replication protein A 70 kDa DNA-binding subunit C-like [Tanacetum cinerariifolium]
MLEFDGETTIRKVSVNGLGFLRYRFQLIDFDRNEPANNKYLIDVTGYVTNVGRTTYTKSGSKTFDFYLANQRVTLWGGIGDVLIERKTKHAGMCAVVLTSMSAKNYNNKLYLSSSSSTVIYDNDDIPFLQELKTEKRTKKGWNYPSCDADKCIKGVTQQFGKFLCEACNKTVDYLVFRYMLEVVVADDTTHTSTDDDSTLPTAIRNSIGTTHVLELKSHTYYEYGTFESFTCWKINPAELVEDSASSNTQALTADDPMSSLKRLSRHPSMCTPLKPNEEKKKKRSELEDSDKDEVCSPVKDSDKRNTDGALDKKKKKRYIVDNCGSEKMAKFHQLTYINNYEEVAQMKDQYIYVKLEKLPKSSIHLCRNQTTAFIDKETSKGVDEQTFSCLIQMLDQYSLVAKAFRMARDWCNIHNSVNFHLRLHSERKTTRQYNAPTVFEVAALIIDDFGDGLLQEILFCICHRIPKRGLPYTHILLWLEEHCKCKTPSEIDDIILTDLPSPTHDPDGYKVVTEYMLHGPCGKDARYAACTSDGKCSKHFPEAFLQKHSLMKKDTLIIIEGMVRGVTGYEQLMMVNKRPLKLWEEIWQALFEDNLHKKHKLFKYPEIHLTDEQIRNYCLLEIQESLHRYGRSSTDFNDLPQPNPNLLTDIDNRLIREALDFDIKKSKAEHEQLHSLLNIKQWVIYEDVVQSVHNKKRKLLFCLSPEGRRDREDFF